MHSLEGFVEGFPVDSGGFVVLSQLDQKEGSAGADLQVLLNKAWNAFGHDNQQVDLFAELVKGPAHCGSAYCLEDIGVLGEISLQAQGSLWIVGEGVEVLLEIVEEELPKLAHEGENVGLAKPGLAERVDCSNTPYHCSAR